MIPSFRWFGSRDPIPLTYIRQIPGMQSVVTALFDCPPGQLWGNDELSQLAEQIDKVSLRFDVVESLPVHEDIKLGRSTRDKLIDIYCENILRLSRIGVSVICYNFMPLFDWMRTNLDFVLPDGATATSFDQRDLDTAADPWEAKLPAYFPLDETPEELKAAYRSITETDLRENLAHFLACVIPVAEEANIKMAIHPDDPPWPIFNLPRIVKNRDDLAYILECVDSAANGITFCTGSLGANAQNDLPAMIREFGSRIHFAHCRNIKKVGEKAFYEAAHPRTYGDVDLVAVMKAFREINFAGPMRPDHGRMIWGETGMPGYGLYDRALGSTYLLGLWHALS